ncbi:MAG: carbohydrate ABC transporter permease [Clostridia bacterium]|nr:carbohydrate ABC transporter permease [Clostridia bacterium]
MVGMITITFYPILYVAFASMSDSNLLMAHSGLLIRPLGFNLKGYTEVFKNPMTLSGFGNTIFYVGVGTLINMFVTTLGAYALSRPQLWIKKYVNLGIVFTMFFSGGLIPLYILVKNIGIYDTRLSLLLPVAVNSWNYMVMRSSFAGFSKSIEEAAKIDGANDFQILFKIALPVFGSTLAVMVLFYSVGHWNSWFQASIFLRKRNLYPLQLYLREVLILSNTEAMSGSANTGDALAISETIKYSTVMISTIPILVAYPFLQKYFVNGVMVGAVKE